MFLFMSLFGGGSDMLFLRLASSLSCGSTRGASVAMATRGFLQSRSVAACGTTIPAQEKGEGS